MDGCALSLYIAIVGEAPCTLRHASQIAFVEGVSEFVGSMALDQAF